METILDTEFGKSFMNENMIAEWICSKDARYFMDSCENEEYFKDNIIERIMDFDVNNG